MLGIAGRTKIVLSTGFLSTCLIALVFVLFPNELAPFAWWFVTLDVLVFAVCAAMFAVRERRLRDATERVIGRKLNSNEPLATAWLRWARHVREQLRVATRERQDIEVVLENMGEGILVLNESQLVTRINSAAERLLGVKRALLIGQHYREVIPQQAVVRFIGSILVDGSQAEVDITLAEGDARYLQASGQVLSSNSSGNNFSSLASKDVSGGGTGKPRGIVIVLNELTRLRRLERARRDFVANVSHELKTPITSIQGFVETIIDGAIDSREDTLRFLGIIQRQSERLGQIFNDMLTLSRIEAEQDLEAAPADLFSLARSVVGSLDWKARERKVVLILEGKSIPIKVNGQLIEQAVANLVDNAIKYGAASLNGKVVVNVSVRENWAVLAVIDNGPGIEARHLPRIFERFYRIDKGRSRNEGGTGLGLAIVKHIAQAHGGQASVASEPGVRTVFEINLPMD